MIDQIDQRLKDWVGSVLTETPVSLAPPAPDQQGVNLYLLELTPMLSARGPQRAPLQVRLRYLVSTWAEQPETAHRLLGELVFAAMEHEEFEVEPEPVPAATWSAFGTAPRPSFVLRVPLRQPRPEPPARYVRRPLVVRHAPLRSLSGVVLGPDDEPLAGAQVELPALRLARTTDAQGRFEFAGVPGEPSGATLLVRAKGRQMSVTLEHLPPNGEPVPIHFNIIES